MRIDVVTLFPELLEPFLATSMVGRALAGGQLQVRRRSPREFGIGKHRNVDDTPYGGGPGMVMRVDCIVACLEALDGDAPLDPPSGAPLRGYRVLLSPQGERLTQRHVVGLAARPAVTLICGRYEGVDERVRSHVDAELSLGDFVLSGGEVAAMALIDACARHLPGVLGNPDSLTEESHSLTTGGLLEYPQYTRPVEFRGERVPDVLQSGDHGRIAAWRQEQAQRRTALRRPDLLPDEAASAPGSAGGDGR
ncbi:MAG: tRNA (guanosine(37)-N1)-methyltransferase TrmD [Deltaproteobacteria bacterium]|jgi:tRNA (guanine37-N1)-methyltransferase|nr:tRNA (guanosine(37)-N1)-methyltransferase TrmD [Deltaproteobacteria bacterium]MBW2534590.1 tRNA (guanosine(37)-N1)-methyltransferase TrmD [Deltaproteobacteria bacterium]